MPHETDPARIGFDIVGRDPHVVVGHRVAVLRFREGFDLAPFIARLDEYGFDEEAVGGVTIRSHVTALAAEWLQTTDFGILDTALLAGGRTLVLASSRDALDAALIRPGDAMTDVPEHMSTGDGPVRLPLASPMASSRSTCNRSRAR